MRQHAFRISHEKASLAVVLTIILSTIGFLSQKESIGDLSFLRFNDFDATPGIVPADLLRLGLYREDDFENEAGIVPPYWSCEHNICNVSTIWGPCYAPRGRTNWKKEV